MFGTTLRLLATIGFSAWVSAQAPQAAFGDEAPVGCWPVAGGGFARSGAAAGGVETNGLSIDWEWSPSPELGALEGEPVVWNDLAFATTLSGANRRRLVAVRTLDGSVVDSIAFTTTATLAPSVFGGFVVVRSAPNRIAALRVADGKLLPFEFFKPRIAAKEVSGPVFTGRDVWIRADAEILRFPFGHESNASSRTPLEGAFGEISLRGDYVFCAERYGSGARIAYFATKDGAFAGRTETAFPFEPASDAWVAALPDHLFLFPGAPTKANAPPAPTALFDRANDAQGALSFGKAAVFEGTAGRGAIRRGDGFVAGAVDGERGALLIRARSGEAFLDGTSDRKQSKAEVNEMLRRADLRVLASRDMHPTFIPVDGGPTHVGGVVVLPGGVFDARSSRILARLDASSRVIPTRGGLLARRGRSLALWRAKTPGTESRPSVATLSDAVAVLVDGGLARGPMSIEEPGLSPKTTARKPPPPIPWSRVSAIFENAKGAPRLVHAADSDSHADALGTVGDAESAETLARLSLRAAEAGDAAVARELIDDALAAGASVDKDSPATAALRRLRNGIKSKRDPAAVEAIVAEAEAARSASAALLAAAAELCGPEDPVRAARLLRRAFERAPRHGGALATLQKSLPKFAPKFDPTDPAFDPIDWSDFVASVREDALRPLERPTLSATESYAKAFGRAVETWGELSPIVKESLYALGDDEVVVVARGRNPALAAECAVAARSTCAALTKLFPGKSKPAEPPPPLEAWLFPTKSEWLRQSAKEFARLDRDFAKLAAGADEAELAKIEERFLRDAREGLSGVAGFYDERLGKAKLFAPSEEDPLQSVVQVFRHEIVHAWLDLRNPATKAKGARRTSVFRTGFRENFGGYWCVEGFPTFLMEQTIDATSHEVIERDDGFTLDFIAHVDRILPWKAVVTVPQFFVDEERRTAADWKLVLNRVAVKEKWKSPPVASLKRFVGVDVLVDEKLCFYRQAAALCHYLHFADGGARRAKLLDFIVGYYDGDDRVADFAAHFGMEPAEAGAAAIAYARSKFR